MTRVRLQHYREIENAKENKEKFAADPAKHTFRGRSWR
jgi:hypothetical protein